MDPHIERAIAERARTQLGLITRPQLLDLGLSYVAIRRRGALGLLDAVGMRTFRLAGVPPSPEGEALAACLDLGGVASHATAAWLHGLLPRPRRVDVSVPKGRSTGAALIPATWRIHTSTNLPADDVASKGPIPVTSVARTLLGLAALPPEEVPFDTLRNVAEEAVARRLASDRWLWWLLEGRRCRGRNGVSRLEEVLARRAGLGRTESWLERELLHVLAEGGLPRPVVQRVVRRRGAFVARVDALYEKADVVLEAMGYTTHRTRPQMDADLRRSHALREQGYEVLPFSYDQIVREPRWVQARVRRALIERNALAA